MISRLILFLCGILFSVGFLAQPGEVPVEIRDGARYHVHTVKRGQTAYAISRLYQVSINELYEVNPESEKGLNVGQKLYFPIREEGLQGENQQNGIDTIGKNILVHTVEKGETFYSIARKYGVPVEDIIAANKVGPLSIGSNVNVPIDNAVKDDEVTPIVKDPVNPMANPGDSIILHKVKKGETLYFLSKLYHVSIEKIMAVNGGLPKGLKKGMKLRIPLKKKVTNVVVSDISDSLNTVSDTLIVSDSLLPYDTIPLPNTTFQEVYDVAVMVPFFFKENRARKAKCPPIGGCPMYSHTLRALDFHHGVMMAVDSLKKAGINLNVHFYNTKNDTAATRKILISDEFTEIDLIIGPFYSKQIKLVREYAKDRQIQLICPVPVSNKALFNNPYVTKMIASTPTQVEYMAKEIARQYHDQNVILVRNQKDKKDEYYYRIFKNAYAEELQKYSDTTSKYPDSVKEAYVDEKGSRLSAVESKMVLDKNNIIVVPSQSVGHVSNFITKLGATTNASPYRKYPVEVFGLEEWSDFPTIDEKYKNKFNLHLVTSSYVSYRDKRVTDFIREYRSKFLTDPSEYSFIGFDAAFINLKGLFLYGIGFSNYYHLLENEGYNINSLFEKVDEQSGYENKNVFILEYDDYTIIKE